VRRLSAALLFLIAAAAARADWNVVSTQTEPGAVSGSEHRHIVLENSDTGERATIELALFSSKSCTLRVLDNPDGEKSLSETMAQEKCVAGMNGGYFNPDFAPIGLRIVDGKVLAPLVRARLLTGVLASSPRGTQIMRVAEFSRRSKLDAAVECGPFLVDLGVAVRGLDESRSARRTFAAVDRGDHVALGFCSDNSLAELGKILSSASFGGFKVWRALNLDGGSSSAFWFKRKDGSVLSIPEQKTVRDFVGVVAK
jgi:phosphodiester glycosidase